MKGRYTLLLLILNLAVAGVIVYLHILKNNRLEESAVESEIFSINLNDADYLKIEGRELNATRIIEKRNGEWLISSPMQWKANLHAVNRVLNQLRWLKPQGSFSWEETRHHDQSLEDYGLAQPRLTVTIGIGTRRESLRIGSATTVGDRIYALSPDDRQIYVLSHKIVEALLMQMDDIRSHDILAIPPTEVSALRIQNREDSNRTSSTALIREGKQWNFETPIRARASSELVEETLSRLSQTQASRFLDVTPDAFEQYGVANGKLSILLEGNNRRETLLIGNKVEATNTTDLVEHVYARLASFPTIFTIPARQLERLYEPQTRLRERRILNFNGRSPIEIRIVEGNKSLNLQKQENGQWQFLRKNEQGEFTPEKADQPLLDFIVEFLDRTQVMEFVLDAPTQEDLVRFGLSSPMMEITLSNPGEQTLLIGSLAGEDGLYAQKKGELFVYKITDSLLDWITADALFYRDRILQRLPSGIQIQSITWGEVDSASPPVQWQFNGDSTPINETETALRNRTVELLREMEVERYLSENFQTEIRNNQWKDKLSITWSLRGGADTSKVNRSFYFSPLSNSGIQYGGSPELDVTFILTPEWIQLLEALQDHYRPAKPVLGPPPGEQTPDPLVEGSKTDVPSLPPAAPPESSESTESP